MATAPKMGEIGISRIDSSEMRFLTLKLSQLAFEALGAGASGDGREERRMEVGIRFYLRDRAQNRPEWPYPGFLRGSEVKEDVELHLGLDAELWRAFEAEAARQDVSVAQLAEHAAFYLAAELDAGRITQRILDELEADEPGA